MTRLPAGIRRVLYIVLGAVSVNLAAAATAHATPIVSSTPLAGADVAITFDEIVLAEGATVTDEYAAYGVRFSPQLYYDSLYPTELPGFPAISGHRLGNFIEGSGPSITDPFSIMFDNDVVAASLALATNLSLTRVTAFLDGVGIESFLVGTLAAPAGVPASYLGFTFIGISGFTFDELRVDVCMPSSSPGACVSPGTALIDDVRYTSATPRGVAAVPEPASLTLLATGGLGVLAKLRRRRKTSQA